MSSNNIQKVIYTPESQLKNPRLMIREMWLSLLASRELAWQIFVRDIKAKYRQSALGIFWAFIPTIVTAIGFTLAKDTGVLNIGETDIPYPVYVMLSTALWQTFVQSINAPIQGILSGKGMMSKIKFPYESLVLAKLGELLLDFAIQLILIIGLFIWFKIQPPLTIFLAPVALIHMIMLGVGIGLFLTPINTLYSDVSQLLNFAIRLWWFITPVVFPVPQKGIFKYIVGFNPVTPLLVTTRELATTGVLTKTEGFWVVSIFALVILILGWVFWRLAMPFVVERVS